MLMRRYLFNANHVDITVIKMPNVSMDPAKTIKESRLNEISNVSKMLFEVYKHNRKDRAKLNGHGKKLHKRIRGIAHEGRSNDHMARGRNG